MNVNNVIKDIETAQMKTDLPDFRAGDTVVVQVKVKEGNRERLQAFEGVVIAKRNRQLNSSFTVRKISHGEGVERVFQTHSPQIASIQVKRRGDVRRAKLYYLRELSGRAARIKERLIRKNNTNNTASNNTESVKVSKEMKATKEIKETKTTKETKKAKEDNTNQNTETE